MAEVHHKLTLSTPSNLSADVGDVIDNLNISNVNVAQVRIGIVTKIDLLNNFIEIYSVSDKQSYPCNYPGHMTNWSSGTGFWHGFGKGDVVLFNIGYGNKVIVWNKIGNNLTDEQIDGLSNALTDSLFFNSNISAQDVDFKNLLPGDFLIKSENNIKLRLSQIGAFLGNVGRASLTFDTTDINASQSGTSTIEANQKYDFSTSGYSLEGLILRDRRIADINGNNDPVIDSRILFQWYKDLQNIGADPSIQVFEKTTETSKRNPPFVEKRDVVYEFSDYGYDDPIESDEKEKKKQVFGSQINRSQSVSRRKRKSDTFSLSLISPNYLIEEIKGTAVDAFGNIIDLNRTILPIGENNGIVKLDGKEESYLKVRELHRKSIAFHWELNARKDPKIVSPESGNGTTYAPTSEYYKKDRSRFFLDIDKEGQIKLNVPCSSEKGNVSVLARYENTTNINPNEKEGKKDYDYFSRSKDVKTDILLDTFGIGVAELVGNDKLLPKDRIVNTSIKVGTVYHDISTTCVTPLPTDDVRQSTGILSGPDTLIEDMNKVKRDVLKNTIVNGEPRTIINKKINIDGDSANAGGRSMTAIFDGMISTSIGANTIDRQSLWLDTQGGIVSRVGADKNGISWATQTDGDFYLQVGGEPKAKDPDIRFQGSNIDDTPNRACRVEIRVFSGNGPGYSRFLIDNKGILLSSNKNIELRADEDVIIYAGSNIHIDSEKIIDYDYTINNDEVRPSRQTRDFSDIYAPDAGAVISGRAMNGGSR